MTELRRQNRDVSRHSKSVSRTTLSRSQVTRQFLKKLMVFGSMAGVGALLVSTSLPANAVQSSSFEELAVSAITEKQSVAVESSAADIVVSRDEYTVVKPPPPPPPKPRFVSVAAVTGSYTNNPNGTIQWPFPSSPITSGWGARGGAFHNGVDFFPGRGTPIGAVADGIVSKVSVDSGGWGNYITIDHNINGQTVQTLYAHMQWGSISVATGQQVTVGQFVGAVGETGRAYGAHLHLEVRVNGASVDPYAWLVNNAN